MGKLDGHYSIFCPICGEDSVARVRGEATDFRDGYTSHQIGEHSYIHKEQTQNHHQLLKDVEGEKLHLGMTPPNKQDDRIYLDPEVMQERDLKEGDWVEVKDGRNSIQGVLGSSLRPDEGLSLLRLPPEKVEELNAGYGGYVKVDSIEVGENQDD